MGSLSPVHGINDAKMIQILCLGCSSNLDCLKKSIQYILDNAGSLCRAETPVAVVLRAVGVLTFRCFLLDLNMISVAQIGASYHTNVAPVTQIQTSSGLNVGFLLFQHEFLRRMDADSRLHGSCPPAARMRTSCRVHAGSLAACMGST